MLARKDSFKYRETSVVAVVKYFIGLRRDVLHKKSESILNAVYIGVDYRSVDFIERLAADYLTFVERLNPLAEFLGRCAYTLVGTGEEKLGFPIVLLYPTAVFASESAVGVVSVCRGVGMSHKPVRLGGVVIVGLLQSGRLEDVLLHLCFIALAGDTLHYRWDKKVRRILVFVSGAGLGDEAVDGFEKACQLFFSSIEKIVRAIAER